MASYKIEDLKIIFCGYEAYPINSKVFIDKLKVLTSGEIFK